MKKLILLILILFLSCDDPITEGTVHDKKLEPAYVEHGAIGIDLGDITIYTPTTTYHEEKCYIFIRLWKEENKKYLKRKLHVSKEIYDKINIDDYIVYDELKDTFTNMHVTEKQY